MRPHDEKDPTGGTADTKQERREQAHAGGAKKDDNETETGRRGASENVDFSEQPGEPKVDSPIRE